MASLRLLPALLAAFVMMLPGAVNAFPVAPTEVETRPCFETLPDPAISLWCGYRPYHRHGGWGWDYRVVCEHARPGAVSWLLDHMHPGATLVLVGGARPCRDNLVVRRPVTIVGEPGWLGGARVATLEPFDEQRPCIRIEAEGHGAVTLRNLLIRDEHAGENACVLQNGRELAFDNVWLRYNGRGSAVVVNRGRFTTHSSVIAAKSEQAAVVASGQLEMDSSTILAATVGLVAHSTEDSRFRGLNIERLDDWSGTERVKVSVGLSFISDGTDRINQVEGVLVEGFTRGVYAEGVQELSLQNLVVRDSEYGVLSKGPRLRVNSSEIEAVEAGVYAAEGHAWAANNKIIGVRRAGIYVEKGKAKLEARDNTVFAQPDGCQALAVEGLDPGSQSCRPWFEAPEFYRTGRLSGRPLYDDIWPDERGSISAHATSGF